MNLSVVVYHRLLPYVLPSWHGCHWAAAASVSILDQLDLCKWAPPMLQTISTSMSSCFIIESIIVLTCTMFITIKNVVQCTVHYHYSRKFPRYPENLPDYSGIFPDSFPHLLCSKLWRHNRLMPITWFCMLINCYHNW